MTISSTTVKVSYSGNGSTTVFAYTFKILDDDEIQVIIRSSTGTETVKTITTHYTVSGVGSSGGGNITFLTAPTATQTVVLRRLTTQTQETDYIANDPFPADSHEDALDRITMVAQEIQEELGRAIKLSKTNTITSTEFTVDATDRANKILAFDTNGELAVTQELGTYQGNWATATAYYARDIIKDTSNNNIYIANTAHTSTGSQPISTNADVAKWDLLVDAASASTSANSAANHAANSSNFANNSSNSANTSANHSANSSNFANNSSNSASNAANSEAGVAANAANSSNFANNSSNSANSASNHSANSSNFANNSSNSANNSSNSANSSANHSANSSNFANNSSNSANTSANHASNSSNHSANSSNFANNSSNSANTSANHASNSSNHASNSSNHASNSSNHSANSSNFANNSSNHSSNASNAANAANSARDAALVAADNFDDVYLGSKASDPTLDNDGDALTAGDLYYNSVGTVLKYYTGSAWVSITSGGITDLVQDTSPQLGAALDVNTFSITSTSNGNITLQPNGTGDVVLSADTVKIGDANTDATITTDGTGDITISTNSGSNSGTVKIFDGVNANIEITPNGSGVVKLDGLSYPIADGSANQVLQTNGSGVLSFATLTADGTADWDTTVKTTGFTATANKGYFCNTTSAAFTVTLPASPTAADEVIILDYAGTFDTNALVISPNGNKIEGATDSLKLSGEREGVRLVYIDSTQGWLAYSGINEGTDALATTSYTADFLVIAGGGGGGRSTGGGGAGAGGYRNSYSTETSGGGGSSEASLTFNLGTVYTITVGGGGASSDTGAARGTSGVDSLISGTGLTTITSAGGAGGGSSSQAAISGGSGGGGAETGTGETASAGTANQGFAGGNAASGGNDEAGGGGGGAGALGNAGQNPSTAGAGGAGLASSITGSSVTRGGGGGGSTYNGTLGAGGSGGGGAGSKYTPTINRVSGTVNTGGGGGGGDRGDNPIGSGGSGVVILRMLTANYSGTTTGSPTVTTSGIDTILVFNASGSYTG
jgi:hypothetical protein